MYFRATIHLVGRRYLISTVLRCQRGAAGLLCAAALAIGSGDGARGVGSSRAWGEARAARAAFPPWQLTVAPVYAHLASAGAVEAPGGGARVEVRRAITAELGAQLGGFLSVQRRVGTDPASGRRWGELWGVGLDAVYLVDLARWVPRVEAGLGLLWRGAGMGEPLLTPLLHLGLGLDHAPRTWLAVGLALHYYAPLEQPLELPTYLQIGPRLALRW
ncbi:MAG: hypothetical protein IPL40_05165 [Proteobacteria bacterium]|nr:hypothetical protein [Pseudomonadota bacterium]